MTQTVMLFLLLTLVSTGAAAQPSQAAMFADKDKSNSHDSAEIQGCLQRQDGYFILVDKNNEYERLSNNNALKKFVGHEVRLSGKPEIHTIDNTPPGGASSAKQVPYFQVKSVEDINPNCQTYGQ
jgi:hypothetical protein